MIVTKKAPVMISGGIQSQWQIAFKLLPSWSSANSWLRYYSFIHDLRFSLLGADTMYRSSIIISEFHELYLC